MAVKSAQLFASESIQHEAEVLFEIKSCPFIIERFGKETTTTTDKGDKVYKLLLEYAAGGTLDGLIQRSNGHGLPEAHVKMYTRCILEGLIHIPKCEYSTTTSSFVAKIADFGLSKRSKEKYSGWRGTPRYLSPEALKVMKQDESCDIWSLGCIVFEMLVGKSPWELKPGCSDRVDILDVTMLDHLVE
ncbi:mitogen-activated protein kinase kinase kinase 2-like [Pyrus ussuriensis x Pyrus communis]|uniref:Mitogen-activated protein kinase kinase kinase 2-like n=1 Tax=Pyrus ussuriensis x Pyrus communis TaxID=2448454 RepID=A0A5N5GBJ7_9ROSA|nr:mitogen-activated protein kinase kinase kinase 2-like [Pyrus ussuriensis x Pyrus communis]